MKIQVNRNHFNQTSTISDLSIDGEFICLVLEDIVREVIGQPVSQWKIQNQTAIPRGTYKVVINHSAHFNKELPQILNVPGFEGVRIHCGNKADDTEGCLLVGSTNLGDTIGGSRTAFDKLFPMMKAAFDSGENIEIDVK